MRTGRIAVVTLSDLGIVRIPVHGALAQLIQERQVRRLGNVNRSIRATHRTIRAHRTRRGHRRLHHTPSDHRSHRYRRRTRAHRRNLLSQRRINRRQPMLMSTIKHRHRPRRVQNRPQRHRLEIRPPRRTRTLRSGHQSTAHNPRYSVGQHIRMRSQQIRRSPPTQKPRRPTPRQSRINGGQPRRRRNEHRSRHIHPTTSTRTNDKLRTQMRTHNGHSPIHKPGIDRVPRGIGATNQPVDHLPSQHHVRAHLGLRHARRRRRTRRARHHRSSTTLLTRRRRRSRRGRRRRRSRRSRSRRARRRPTPRRNKRGQRATTGTSSRGRMRHHRHTTATTNHRSRSRARRTATSSRHRRLHRTLQRSCHRRRRTRMLGYELLQRRRRHRTRRTNTRRQPRIEARRRTRQRPPTAQRVCCRRRRSERIRQRLAPTAQRIAKPGGHLRRPQTTHRRTRRWHTSTGTASHRQPRRRHAPDGCSSLSRSDRAWYIPFCAKGILGGRIPGRKAVTGLNRTLGV